MLCFEEIRTEFIYLHTSKAFRDKYFNIVATKVLNEEKLLIKATKEYLHAKKQIGLLNSRLTNIFKHLEKYPDDISVFSKLCDESRSKLNVYSKIIEKTDFEISKSSITKICPLPNCEGLVSKNICSECGSKLCGKCNEKINDSEEETEKESHVCDPDTIKTLYLIKKDTKSCPKCSVLIHKIEGCDQMFCTKCNTAFSWRTGKIDNGVVHNPHYFEWMRERNGGEILRQPGDDPCETQLMFGIEKIFGGNLSSNKFAKRNTFCHGIVKKVFIEKILNELNVVITSMSTSVNNPDILSEKKRKLRIKFVSDKCEPNTFGHGKKKESIEKKEETWFKSLKLVLRKHEMNKDILNLLQTFERGLKDAIIIASRSSDLDQLECTIVSLHSYFEEQIIQNKKRHGLNPSIAIVIPYGLKCSLIN
jgi:hypothetical protein